MNVTIALSLIMAVFLSTFGFPLYLLSIGSSVSQVFSNPQPATVDYLATSTAGLLGVIACLMLAALGTRGNARRYALMRLHGASVMRMWRNDIATSVPGIIAGALTFAVALVFFITDSGGEGVPLFLDSFVPLFLLIIVAHVVGIQFALLRSSGGLMDGTQGTAPLAVAFLASALTMVCCAVSQLPLQFRHEDWLSIPLIVIAPIICGVDLAGAWGMCHRQKMRDNHVYGRSAVKTYGLFILGEIVLLAAITALGAAYYSSLPAEEAWSGLHIFDSDSATGWLAALCAVMIVSSLITLGFLSRRVGRDTLRA